MNRICKLFDIEYPIIQGGMIWASGWKLASAVSNAGGLGLIGAASMYPETFREHVQKCKKATKKPFGVNVPIMYPNMDEVIQIIIEEGVKIVFTSAGNPKKYTALLQSHGIKVAHVVSSLKFALKCEDAGVDAVVAEGFEAGGHNGREETTTLCLIPIVARELKIPLIAAGGIGTGAAMLACEVLGADGFQLGSRFVATHEASSHIHFKEKVIEAKEGDTQLTLKEIVPVRLLKNEFYQEVEKSYKNRVTTEELLALKGRARPKNGMFQGDVKNGMLEIGQVAGLIDKISSASEVVENLMEEYHAAKIKVNLILKL